MKRAVVPRVLQDQLGDDATEALVYVFDTQQQQMTEDIIGRIDARTDRLEQRFDLRTSRLEERLDRISAKQEGFTVALERGFGAIRADMAAQRADTLKWMFLFWAGQAFVVLAYFRAGQYLAGR